MNKQPAVYPNILNTPQQLDFTPKTRRPTSQRKFIMTNAKARAFAHDDQKHNNVPRFICPECNTAFALHFSKFMRDATKPFIAPTYVCRICSKLSKYELA